MRLIDLMDAFTRFFPFWILLGAVASFLEPTLFTWFSGPWITVGLALIMLGMGVTLRPEDFGRIFLMPRPVLLGVFLQYLIMPLLGYGVGLLFHLPAPFAVGLILVASCPGGTASNVIAFLARANLALSVTMTAFSTMLATLMTPLLTSLLVGNRLEVDAFGLFLSTVQVVILPIVVGVLLNRFAHGLTARMIPFSPPVAVVMIVLIVSSILGQGREAILNAGPSLLGATVTLHSLGFLLGYLVSRFFVSLRDARTISIEVGMQNSGLGVVLARNNFPDPLVSIPSALSSLVHSVLGSVAAALFRAGSEGGHSSREEPDS